MDTIKKDLVVVFTIITVFVVSIISLKIIDNKTQVVQKIGKQLLDKVLK